MQENQINTREVGNVQQVFISYSHTDLLFASHLKAELEKSGYLAWLDTTSIPGGDIWIEKITQGINESFAFVSIVSKDANESRWVRREYLYADEQKKHILPVTVDSSGFPFYMLDKQACKFSGDFNDCFACIKDTLDRWCLRLFPPKRAIKGPTILRSDSRRRCLDRILIKYAIWLEQYTPMAGVSEILDRSDEFAFRTVETSIEQEFETFLKRELQDSPGYIRREYTNIVDAITNLHPQRAVILGESGAGKTTTLWRLVAEYCKKALPNEDAPIPVIVPLGNYVQEISLVDYIKQICSNILSDLVDELPDLIKSNSVILLLDGLNEIPQNVRRERIAEIQSFLDQHQEMSIIISCRELDYIDLGLAKIYIKPLDALRVRAFILNYIIEKDAADTLFWQLAGEKAREYWERFSNYYSLSEEQFWLGTERPQQMNWYSGWDQWIEYRDNPRSMLGLARNPFMLYMMSKVYAKQGVVPTNKGQLFHLFVNFLLRQELNKGQTDGIKLDPNIMINCLSELAYRMQLSGTQGTLIDENTALGYMSPAEGNFDLIQVLYIARSANTLSFGKELQFTHQMLQEYFAANRLDQIRKSGASATQFWQKQNWWENHQWDETAVLLTGLYNADASPVISWIAPANPELAARCAVNGGANIPKGLFEQYSPLWVRDILDPNIPVFARAATARGLALVDVDTRAGIGLTTGSNIPDIAWSQTIVIDNLTLKFSRYPITNKQFSAFIAADQDGYNNNLYWSTGGLKWKVDRKQPDYYDVYPYYLSNHPRINVRWYEAIAFCRWLSRKLGTIVRLPTEREWVQAATGGSSSVYPYGNTFEFLKANTRECGLKSTSAVGIFPGDASPDGLFDMSGNVREWCINSYDNPLEIADLIDIDGVSQSNWRAVRGCAFDQDKWFARNSSRNFRSPSDAARNLGFRIVMVEVTTQVPLSAVGA